jgi:hypothetical protein
LLSDQGLKRLLEAILSVWTETSVLDDRFPQIFRIEKDKDHLHGSVLGYILFESRQAASSLLSGRCWHSRLL